MQIDGNLKFAKSFSLKGEKWVQSQFTVSVTNSYRTTLLGSQRTVSLNKSKQGFPQSQSLVSNKCSYQALCLAKRGTAQWQFKPITY